ncbi:hypothetical protein C9374_003919 [Naegleria lovaniensis]|uniref:GATA-type domain-containing protein n=1 Tax=Naegleria lovaniensis TaxID=51637 RepID=A0AA88H3X3_NAELO|nr:uncharacterized protein C9374_003919 [Naegleria lovaniensis]KAG2394155.1 hypothetical protein C9374_003919 [Naegleria lovaniensis]
MNGHSMMITTPEHEPSSSTSNRNRWSSHHTSYQNGNSNTAITLSNDHAHQNDHSRPYSYPSLRVHTQNNHLDTGSVTHIQGSLDYNAMVDDEDHLVDVSNHNVNHYAPSEAFLQPPPYPGQHRDHHNPPHHQHHQEIPFNRNRSGGMLSNAPTTSFGGYQVDQNIQHRMDTSSHAASTAPVEHHHHPNSSNGTARAKQPQYQAHRKAVIMPGGSLNYPQQQQQHEEQPASLIMMQLSEEAARRNHHQGHSSYAGVPEQPYSSNFYGNRNEPMLHDDPHSHHHHHHAPTTYTPNFGSQVNNNGLPTNMNPPISVTANYSGSNNTTTSGMIPPPVPPRKPLQRRGSNHTNTTISNFDKESISFYSTAPSSTTSETLNTSMNSASITTSAMSNNNNQVKSFSNFQPKPPKKSPKVVSRQCENPKCNTTDTPLWRKGFAVEGGRRANLCNACGLHYRKGHFCKFCNEIYRDSSELVNAPEPWVTCPKCERWAHKKCLMTALPTIEKQFLVLNRVVCDECMNGTSSNTTTSATNSTVSTKNVMTSSTSSNDTPSPTVSVTSSNNNNNNNGRLGVDDSQSSSHSGQTTPVSSTLFQNTSTALTNNKSSHSGNNSPLNHVVINPTSTSTAFAANSGLGSNHSVGRPQSFQHPTTPVQVRVAQRPFTVSGASENVVSLLKRHNDTAGTFLNDPSNGTSTIKNEPLTLPSIQNLLNKTNF